MKDILKRIFYRIILYIDRKTDDARIYYRSKSLTLGEGSGLSKEAVIYNMQGDIANMVIGKNTSICGELLTFNYGGKIEIGNDCFVGPGTRIWSGESITIGSNVLISHNVNIVDTNAHEMDYLERAEGYRKLATHGYPTEKGSIKTKRIMIHDHAWISFNATVLKGVSIGKGAVVGANSVVTHDVPDYAVVAGNPAVVVKQLNTLQER
jgi:acetyltransferase-like isoleucine patch superfamily enzyme